MLSSQGLDLHGVEKLEIRRDDYTKETDPKFSVTYITINDQFTIKLFHTDELKYKSLPTTIKGVDLEL